MLGYIWNILYSPNVNRDAKQPLARVMCCQRILKCTTCALVTLRRNANDASDRIYNGRESQGALIRTSYGDFTFLAPWAHQIVGQRH